MLNTSLTIHPKQLEKPSNFATALPLELVHEVLSHLHANSLISVYWVSKGMRDVVNNMPQSYLNKINNASQKKGYYSDNPAYYRKLYTTLFTCPHPSKNDHFLMSTQDIKFQEYENPRNILGFLAIKQHLSSYGQEQLMKNESMPAEALTEAAINGTLAEQTGVSLNLTSTEQHLHLLKSHPDSSIRLNVIEHNNANEAIISFFRNDNDRDVRGLALARLRDSNPSLLHEFALDHPEYIALHDDIEQRTQELIFGNYYHLAVQELKNNPVSDTRLYSTNSKIIHNILLADQPSRNILERVDKKLFKLTLARVEDSHFDAPSQLATNIAENNNKDIIVAVEHNGERTIVNIPSNKIQQKVFAQRCHNDTCLQIIAQFGHPEAHFSILHNSCASAETIAMLMDSPLPSLRIAYAHMYGQDELVAEHLASDPEESVRKVIANTAEGPIDVINNFITDQSPVVREALANRQFLSPEIIAGLKNDPIQEVKIALINNKCTPPDTLKYMSLDGDWHVRQTAVDTMKERGCYETPSYMSYIFRQQTYRPLNSF